MSHLLVHSSLEDWSKSYTGPKFHAVLCDPPYGIKFMGKEWDVVNAERWGVAIMPHLYPGALVLMFGSTRKWHHLAVGMEEAGFEMWDTLMWLYGQGFPKGQDISKLIDKRNGIARNVVGFKDNKGRTTNDVYGQFNTDQRGDPVSQPSESSAPWSGHKTPALKPAWEPILAFRAPTKQTYAALALQYGSGALNVDGSRIGTDVTVTRRNGDSGGNGALGRDERIGEWENPPGRYPANLLLDEESGALLDEQTGMLSVTGKRSQRSKDNAVDGTAWYVTDHNSTEYPGDSGGASRFFYCAKASTVERNAGLGDHFEDKDRRTLGCGVTGISGDHSGGGGKQVPIEMGTVKVKNHHPTVKPLALIEYFAKLILPPASVSPRRLLVPFAGSGSEMIGALRAGWDEVTGIEREAEYIPIAEARVRHYTQ